MEGRRVRWHSSLYARWPSDERQADVWPRIQVTAVRRSTLAKMVLRDCWSIAQGIGCRGEQALTSAPTKSHSGQDQRGRQSAITYGRCFGRSSDRQRWCWQQGHPTPRSCVLESRFCPGIRSYYPGKGPSGGLCCPLRSSQSKKPLRTTLIANTCRSPNIVRH